MKVLFLVLGLLVSTASFASLETGSYSCNNKSTLDIYRHDEGFYSAFMIFPQNSGRMSSLDSFELKGTKGAMFTEDYRNIGIIEVLEEGKKLELDFYYSFVTCERI